jgi:hypothetical protein
MERVRLGRESVGVCAENLRALLGAPDTPEAAAGAVHLADAIHALMKQGTK